ncbi:MAG: pentapeptide repeat-containing protein [Alphaproteobacteria bacterium]|nr:pentapeptide repeat-containing protein [Alphaproteobacteria bacterium]
MSHETLPGARQTCTGGSGSAKASGRLDEAVRVIGRPGAAVTPRELVDILRKHERYVKRQADGARADLRGEDLSGLRLPGLKLQDASLAGADFHNSDISQGDFSGADLYGANLERAVASAANFERADMRGIRLCGSLLTKCAHARRRPASRSGARLQRSAARGSIRRQSRPVELGTRQGRQRQAAACVVARGQPQEGDPAQLRPARR